MTKILLCGHVMRNAHGEPFLDKGPLDSLSADHVLSLVPTGAFANITISFEEEKTPGQVAHESIGHVRWETLSETSRAEYETLAQAVLDWDAERRRKVVKDI